MNFLKSERLSGKYEKQFVTSAETSVRLNLPLPLKPAPASTWSSIFFFFFLKNQQLPHTAWEFRV